MSDTPADDLVEDEPSNVEIPFSETVGDASHTSVQEYLENREKDAQNLKNHPYYPILLEGLRNGQSFLDVKCGDCHNLRSLVDDVNRNIPEKLYGFTDSAEKRTAFERSFPTAASKGATVIVRDIEVPHPHNTRKYQDNILGKMDVVYANDLLSETDNQLRDRSLHRILITLKKTTGSTFFGYKVRVPGVTFDGTSSVSAIYEDEMKKHLESLQAPNAALPYPKEWEWDVKFWLHDTIEYYFRATITRVLDD